MSDTFYVKVENMLVSIAYRTSTGGIYWLNELAKFVNDDEQVYVDGGVQDDSITTMKDLREQYKNNKL